MGPPWAQAFAAAGLLTLIGTPLLRRIALATEFIDSPLAAHKSHKRPTPYLGGIGLIVGVLIGLLFSTELSVQIRVVALGGAVIGCLGLVDDHRSISALLRFAAEIGVAALSVAAGLRVHATDVAVIDTAITLVWIAGVSNAVNLLDNMDGLAAGVAWAAAAAIFALAILGEQPVTATLAAALAGACVGFLAHNLRPASIFMGDTGSLFLGFVLAVATIDVTPALEPPGGFLVPLMLLALPVLDTTFVTIARLRHGRSISQGGKDHLSHRLVALGLSSGAAVGALVAIQALVGGLAVLAGREVMPLWSAVAAVVAVLAALALCVGRAEVYTDSFVGLPRRLKLAGMAAVAGAALLAAPAAAALARSREGGTEGARATRHGLEALAAGDAAQAGDHFDRARRSFDRADRILANPLASVGMVVPGVRANVSAARTAVEVGSDIAASASTLASIAESSNVRLAAGPGALDDARRLASTLSSSASLLESSASRLAAADRPYLWGSLRSTVRQLEGQLRHQASATAQAAEMARLLPGILGAEGSKRYFVAVQDNAELRGGGGVIHLWGELVAEEGRLRLAHLGPVEELAVPSPSATADLPPAFLDRYREFDPTRTWQNVNVSPDFSVTGRVITGLYARSGRGALDGVIGVDLRGLAALLDLVGPVEVDGGGAVTSSMLRDAIEGGDHLAYLGDPAQALPSLVRATLARVATADLGPPARLAQLLRPATRAGHLLFYSTSPDEQRLARRLEVAGEVPSVTGDSLLVVNQNLSATVSDRFLHRQLAYDFSLNPALDTAAVAGRLQVTLRNDAPPTPAGPPASRTGNPSAAGDNRTYLSVYTPLGLASSHVEGRPAIVDSDRELGRYAYSSTFDIPPQEARTLELGLRGEVALRPGNWYELDLLQQPTVQSEDVTVSVAVPRGWRIAETRGMRLDGERRAVAEVRVDARQRISLRLERTIWSRLWYPIDR